MKKYRKLQRLESAIIEEKLDGSNFSWESIDDTLYFYSRNKLLTTFSLTDNISGKASDLKDLNIKLEQAFYQPFVEYIIRVHAVHCFSENFVWYAEVLGQTKTQYSKLSGAHNNLFVFDIYSKENDRFASRDLLEHRCELSGLQIIPKTTLEHTQSKLNPSIEREGIILRYDLSEGSFKLKHLEPNSQKKNPYFDIWDLKLLAKGSNIETKAKQENDYNHLEGLTLSQTLKKN